MGLDQFRACNRVHLSGRKVLESRVAADEERIVMLQQQLNEARLIAEETDRKYDEVRSHIHE